MAALVAMETRLWNSESQLIIWLHLIRYHLSAQLRAVGFRLNTALFWVFWFVSVSPGCLICPLSPWERDAEFT